MRRAGSGRTGRQDLNEGMGDTSQAVRREEGVLGPRGRWMWADPWATRILGSRAAQRVKSNGTHLKTLLSQLSLTKVLGSQYHDSQGNARSQHR